MPGGPRAAALKRRLLREGVDQACQPADASRVIHTRLVRYFPRANCEAAAEELDESKEVGQDRPQNCRERSPKFTDRETRGTRRRRRWLPMPFQGRDIGR